MRKCDTLTSFRMQPPRTFLRTGSSAVAGILQRRSKPEKMHNFLTKGAAEGSGARLLPPPNLNFVLQVSGF